MKAHGENNGIVQRVNSCRLSSRFAGNVGGDVHEARQPRMLESKAHGPKQGELGRARHCISVKIHIYVPHRADGLIEASQNAARGDMSPRSPRPARSIKQGAKGEGFGSCGYHSVVNIAPPGPPKVVDKTSSYVLMYRTYLSLHRCARDAVPNQSEAERRTRNNGRPLVQFNFRRSVGTWGWAARRPLLLLLSGPRTS